jgi:hypothetical protein
MNLIPALNGLGCTGSDVSLFDNFNPFPDFPAFIGSFNNINELYVGSFNNINELYGWVHIQIINLTQLINNLININVYLTELHKLSDDLFYQQRLCTQLLIRIEAESASRFMSKGSSLLFTP